MITFMIAVVAVALLVLGLSITLIRKGRPLQGDVGENDDMKALGLECTTAAIRRQEAELRGEDTSDKNYCCGSDCTTDCITCDTKEQANNTDK